MHLAERAKRIVIGTGFLTLNPLLLRLARRGRLANIVVVSSLTGTDRGAAETLATGGVRTGFVANTPGGGMFHAKVYGFELEDGAVILIGSGNLTGAALTPGGNTELFTEQQVDAGVIDALEARLWAMVTETDPARVPARVARRPHGGDGSATPGVPARIFDFDWSEYAAALRAQNAAWSRRFGPRFGDEYGWMHTLGLIREVGARPLATSDVASRRVLAGARIGEENPAFFGDLKAAGDAYGHIIRADTPAVVRVLDAARAAVGAVGEPLPPEEAMRALTDIMRLSGFAFAAAARLLGAVRPDIYVILNRASIDRINRVIGDPFPTTDNTPANRRRYLDLLTRVQAAPWWRSPLPDHEREVWEGRALLLDTFFYEDTVG